MLSGPVVAMVWEGKDVVKTGRSKFPPMRWFGSNADGFTTAILGATNPLASAPGTIRGDFALVRPPIPATY